MSQAFVREEDGQWLDEIRPTIPSLIIFLTRENNGIPVHEKRSYVENGRQIHVMSNGMSYRRNDQGKWEVFSL